MTAGMFSTRARPRRIRCGVYPRNHVVAPGPAGWTFCSDCFGPVHTLGTELEDAADGMEILQEWELERGLDG